MPLTAGMQLLLTSMIGAFCFGEWPYAWQMGLGFAGIVLIIAGTVLTTHSEAGQQSTSASDIRKGLIITAISSALYMAYATAARFFSVDSSRSCFRRHCSCFRPAGHLRNREQARVV